MKEALAFAVLIPLFSALFLLLTSFKISRVLTSLIACGSILSAFSIFSFFLFVHLNGGSISETFSYFPWIPIQGIEANFSLTLDSLSLWMSMIITGVGFLIHVYSTGYMEDEPDFARYFACLNFFIFSMLILVLSSHLLLLFVGWEGVGLASYLLIGFYKEKSSANQAAFKAFVINRIGDLGFIIALLLTFSLFGTGNIAEITEKASLTFSKGAPILLLLTFLLFFASTGKSAQIPLHTWLADAMEGPTPVSALIHAATMVTAGVYLIVRLHTLFLLAPETMQLIGTVGGVTSLFAALCAVGQTDLKRVLAYSTVSQLGLMFLACGVGAFYPAMFHLTTHAFIKALLFLSAGSLIHAMHGTTEMAQMGGLKKKLPVTNVLFFTGTLALSGIPPFAAFFSKDMILEQEFLAGADVLFVIGFLASVLTAFYLTRAYCLSFLGMPAEGQPKNIHEAPKVMLVPVFILGLLAIFGGYLGCVFCEHSFLKEFLGEIGISTLREEPADFLTPETWLSIFGAFGGIGTAFYLFYKRLEILKRPLELLKSAFYFDSAYWKGVAMPMQNISRFISMKLEPFFFEQVVTESANLAGESAKTLQKVQSGEIRSYAAWMVIGAAFLIAYFFS